MHVIVVGLGVIGASVAAALSGRGHKVTVLEEERSAAGASSTTFGWVNGNDKTPAHYQELNADAMREHVRLGGERAGWLVPTGHLEFATDDKHRERLTTRVDRLRETGYRADFVTAAFAASLEPDLRVVREALVAWFPDEAHCFPELYIAAVLGSARVRVETGVRVVAAPGNGTVRLADGSVRTADHVVTCVGRLVDTLHPRVRMIAPTKGSAAVGCIERTAPVAARLSRVVTTEGVNLRPAGDGALLVQTLDQDRFVVPGVPVPDEVRNTMRMRASARMGVEVDLDIARVGLRALPADGLPVAGPIGPHGYVLVGHSGVTLAPLLGELAAREVCGDRQERLEPYRPDRFGNHDDGRTPAPVRLPGEQ